MRQRMASLGKDPRWYSLRSIRQGSSTTADRLCMPEVFLRASGSWKGDALELYRKDRLPEEQARFADLLGSNPSQRLPTKTHQPLAITSPSKPSQYHQHTTPKSPLQFDPPDLLGPCGTGGGQIGKNCSPPPFSLARDGWSSSRPTPPPDRETLFVQADHHHQRGSNPKAPIRFQKGKNIDGC